MIFAIIETKPNITFATSVGSCFAKNLSHTHTKVIKTILKFFRETKNQDIIYSQNTLIIKGYLDLDWIGDKKSRKLTFGYIFILNGGYVSWCFKCQATVTLSLIKVEYIALTLVTKEAIWLRLLLIKLELLKAEDQYRKINVNEKNRNIKTLKDNIKSQEWRESQKILINLKC